MIHWDKGTEELEQTIALACDADANDSRRHLPISDLLLVADMVKYYKESLDNVHI